MLDADNFNVVRKHTKDCQEKWKTCEVLCSSIYPLERIKYQESGCCLMSPIPNTDGFKLLFEPLFSRRTTFALYKEVFHVVIKLNDLKIIIIIYYYKLHFFRIKNVRA